MPCPTLALPYVMIRNTKFISGYDWAAGLLDSTHIADLSSVRSSKKMLVDAWLWYHPCHILDKPLWVLNSMLFIFQGPQDFLLRWVRHSHEAGFK